MRTLNVPPRVGGGRDVGARGGVGAAGWGTALPIDRRPAEPFIPTLFG